MSPKSELGSTKAVVAVFGAPGYTGRFVVAELLRRGLTPIAIARSADALSKADFRGGEVSCRRATVEDLDSLARALDGARAVINCAGPFVDTAEAVGSAALRAGAHYLDVAAEQGTVRSTLEKFDEPGRKSGLSFVPSMAFYGGLADLMVSSISSGWDAVDSVEILMGMDSWHPTKATRNTIERNLVGNLMITGGRLTPAASPPATKRWNHPGEFQDQVIVEVPFAEAILISQHKKVSELHNYLPQIAVHEVLDTRTPNPKAADAMGRSTQEFTVDVVVTRGSERRRAISRGRDIYAVTAPLVCEAVVRLLTGEISGGTHTPGEIFDGRNFLQALGSEHLTFEILTV